MWFLNQISFKLITLSHSVNSLLFLDKNNLYPKHSLYFIIVYTLTYNETLIYN